MTSKPPRKGISRRALLKSGGLITGFAIAGVGTRGRAAEKLPKSQVGFQTSPKGSQQCGNCTHFLPSQHACTVVQGKIEANNWCQLWAAKS